MVPLGKPDPLTGQPISVLPHSRLNLVTTAAGFLLSVGIGLWYTSFLVQNLGPAAYGLVPLATTVVSYFSILASTLVSALNRSISIALAGDDVHGAQRAFSAALGGAVILVAILLPALAVLSWFSPQLFLVPTGMDAEVRLLFTVVGINLLLSIISTPYQAVSFGQNRIYASNLVSLGQTLIRVGLTIGLFTFSATLPNVGWGILIGAAAALMLTVWSARKYSPKLSAFALRFDVDELRGIAKTSSHVLLMQLGTVLVMSLEIVIANLLFGAYEGGRYAAVTQWLLVLRNAIMQAAVLAVPTILRLVASASFVELTTFTRQAMMWIAVLTALPVGFLCVLSPQILASWLGPALVDLWPVAVLQLLPLTIVSTVLPLYSILLGTDRMLVSGLFHIAAGILGVALSIGLGLGWGVFGIAVGVNWIFMLKELVYTPLAAARAVNAKRLTFYVPLVCCLLLVCLAAALSWLGAQLFHLETLMQLFGFGVAVSVVYLVCCSLLFPVLRHRAIALVGLQSILARRQKP
jgi:membrane protein EpsK